MFISEAFWVLNMLPFFALCKYNILNFLNHYKHGLLLPNTFKSDFIFVDHMTRTKDLRSRNTFFLPRVNLEKIRKHRPTNSLIHVLYVKVFKQLKATQPARNSKKMKSIAELIKCKWWQKSARINNMLENARYFWPFDPSLVTLILKKKNSTIANNVYDPIYQIILKLTPLLYFLILHPRLRIRIWSDLLFLHGSRSGSGFQIFLDLDSDPVFKFLWIRMWFQPRFWNKNKLQKGDLSEENLKFMNKDRQKMKKAIISY